MTKFFVIIATLLTFAPVAAHAASKQARATTPPPAQEILPCGPVNTPVGLLVNESTPGYRQVEVTLDIEVPMEFVNDLPSNVTFVFGLDTNERIHRDSLGAIKWLSRCDTDVRRDGRIYKAGSVWMKVRTAISRSDIWPDEKGITVHAFVWLPETLIAQKPAAYTLMKFKNSVWYTGAWDDGEKGAVTLALKPD